MAQLTENSYGKSAVRLTRVVRHGPRHELFEIEAAIQLTGDFVDSYTQGDNRKVIATDSIRNTVYVLAKEHPFRCIEDFAALLANHFLVTYPQVSGATVELTQSSWRRIEVDGRPHDHAFISAGPQRRRILIEHDRDRPPRQTGGVRDLLVLKTTGSEWRDFVSDRYRTLHDTRDRILATRIDADWRFTADASCQNPPPDWDAAHAAILDAILRTFATQHSLGVQQTLLAMGQAALAACESIHSISFELPNQHRVPFDLEPFGLKFENDIFITTDEPYGLIRGTVTREH
ncbi:MAG: urate oxidase [Phycisphaerae bacterium]|nr:urate oxidase [Phycisphaerae bacterium]